MQRLHLFRAASWSAAAALWSLCLWPGFASGGLRDRPTLLCPPEEYHCPFGLGQWLAQQHRFVYGETAGGHENVWDDAPTADVRAPLPAPEPQGSETPCIPDYGCPYYGSRHYVDGDDVDAADGDNAAELAEPRPQVSLGGEEEAGQGSSIRSLAESLMDRRHSMGQRFALRLNRLSDGLEDEIDAEFDVLEPFDSGEAPLPVSEETGKDLRDEEDAEDRGCEVDENCPPSDDASERTDDKTDSCQFQLLGQRLGEAICGAVTQVVDTLSQWSEEAARTEASTQRQTPAPRQLEPRDYIPAFGSPWGGIER